MDHKVLEAQGEEYWESSAGITRRIDALAQAFSYKIVNNGFKVIAPTNKANWLRWVDFGDLRVCLICQRNAGGGRDGFYRVTWFMPEMPPHDGCRCQWEIYFEDPFAGVPF
jgi:hypothetical protein